MHPQGSKMLPLGVENPSPGVEVLIKSCIEPREGLSIAANRDRSRILVLVRDQINPNFGLINPPYPGGRGGLKNPPGGFYNAPPRALARARPGPRPMDFVCVLVCMGVFLCTRSIYQVPSD